MRGWINTISLLVLLFPVTLWAQHSRDDLEKQKEQIQQQIRLTSDLLNKKKSAREASLENWYAVKKQVQNRELLLQNREAALRKISGQVQQTETEVESIKRKQSALQREMGSVMRGAYKMKLINHPFLFVLSAQNFNQLTRRWAYLRKIKSVREGMFEEFSVLRASLEEKKEQMLVLHQQEKATYQEVKEEVEELNRDFAKQDQILAGLKRDEARLLKELQSHRNKQAKITAAIRAVIEEELAKDNSTVDMPASPEVVALSREFGANKGKLPWPVTQGMIIRSFGKQSHPTLKNVTINNNGIDFRTSPGGEARAIFNGEVIGVQYLSGLDHMVILRHGKYYSVYSYLQDVYVTKGEKLQTGDLLGQVRTNKISSLGELHFELWSGKKILDPEAWLNN